ncbi:MAG: exo-alpha-sialidase, partial [Bacteroidia bacterium]|nr:exo-alpha-sialidase [Bacteroidia bacterium]
MIMGMKNLLFIFLVLLFLTGCAQQGKRYGDEVFSGFTTLFQPGMDSDAKCYRIPAICTAPNGDLIAAIDERVPSCDDLRSNPDINIVIRRSPDNGASWSNCETVVDYPLGQSASDPSLIVDHQAGIVFLFYNYMDLTREKDVYYFRVIQSTNNGKSWSDPKDVTAQISKPEWKYDFKFITSGRGIQTQNGRLLHTLVNLTNGLHVFGSDDHGGNWYLLDTPLTPGDESKIAELANGAWMVNSRTHGTGFRYVHISSDEGKSWIS